MTVVRTLDSKGCATFRGSGIATRKSLGFLQKFGWLMRDKEAQTYSAKFKPKK